MNPSSAKDKADDMQIDSVVKPKVLEYNSILYSGWEHPWRHFNHQLQHLKCSNSIMTKNCLSSGLREIMSYINAKRMFSGADMRFQGLQINKMEPCNVVLFTALGPSFFTADHLNLFLNQKPETHYFFQEVFRQD